VSSGNKYNRTIHSKQDRTSSVVADVYSVLDAFDVRCPARAHAIKKLLCSGLRGKGDTMQDLSEAKDAVVRAMELEDRRNPGGVREESVTFTLPLGPGD